MLGAIPGAEALGTEGGRRLPPPAPTGHWLVPEGRERSPRGPAPPRGAFSIYRLMFNPGTRVLQVETWPRSWGRGAKGKKNTTLKGF